MILLVTVWDVFAVFGIMCTLGIFVVIGAGVYVEYQDRKAFGPNPMKR